MWVPTRMSARGSPTGATCLKGVFRPAQTAVGIFPSGRDANSTQRCECIVNGSIWGGSSAVRLTSQAEVCPPTSDPRIANAPDLSISPGAASRMIHVWSLSRKRPARLISVRVRSEWGRFRLSFLGLHATHTGDSIRRSGWWRESTNSWEQAAR